jgi:N-methylhydantoinase A
VLVDEARDLIHTGKRLTTPADASLAITDGVARLLSESGTSIEALHSIVHGTTLVANTVIERKGAKERNRACPPKSASRSTHAHR